MKLHTFDYQRLVICYDLKNPGLKHLGVLTDQIRTNIPQLAPTRLCFDSLIPSETFKYLILFSMLFAA